MYIYYTMKEEYRWKLNYSIFMDRFSELVGWRLDLIVDVKIGRHPDLLIADRYYEFLSRWGQGQIDLTLFTCQSDINYQLVSIQFASWNEDQVNTSRWNV